MQAWTKSAYVNVFRHHRFPFPQGLQSFHLVMARNEHQSFQICLRSEDEFTIQGVSFDDLVGDAGHIPGGDCRYNYVDYVYAPFNSYHMDPDDAVMKAPGWFPDPLSNDRSIHVPRKTTQPIWVTVFVDKGMKIGLYNGRAIVHTTRGDYAIAITVEVCAVTLPDTNQGTLDYMHHQQITGVWWLPSTPGHYPHDPITILYGYNRWTDDWWKLVGDIADQMRAHRQNILYINIPQLIMDSGTEVDENGRFTFRWNRMDEYIRFFMDKRVVKGLEGTHIASIDYVKMHFTTYLLRRNADGVMEVGMSAYDSDESENWLRQFLPALQKHVDEMGWMPIWYQHVGDEAMNDAQLMQYTFYFNKIRELAPKFKVGDPVTHVDFSRHQLDIGTDIQVPIEDAFDNNRELFAKAARDGVRMYLYNCCGPAGKWLNRFVDKPVWHMRTLGWLLYDWDIKGFLHWGFNFWNDWGFTEFLEITEEEFKGDHYTIYPDPHFPHKIRSSIRYEANRDAAQDYELLTILGRAEPDTAKALVKKIARDAHTDYTHDTALMLHTREELVREAARVAGED